MTRHLLALATCTGRCRMSDRAKRVMLIAVMLLASTEFLTLTLWLNYG